MCTVFVGGSPIVIASTGDSHAVLAQMAEEPVYNLGKETPVDVDTDYDGQLVAHQSCKRKHEKPMTQSEDFEKSVRHSRRGKSLAGRAKRKDHRLVARGKAAEMCGKNKTPTVDCYAELAHLYHRWTI